jgi:YfiH family protein
VVQRFAVAHLDIEYASNIHNLETAHGPVAAGVLTRRGWVSNPAGISFWPGGTHARRETHLTRALLAHRLQRDAAGFRLLHQVHGTTVIRRRTADIGGDSAQALPRADGHFTTDAGLTLIVNVADCCPVIVVSPDPPIAGIAHAGWRGAADEIVVALIRGMEAESARVSDLVAWVGACADGARYEVGPEVASRFEAYPDARRPHPGGQGKSFLDVGAVVVRQLSATGVRPERIVRSRGGTISDRRYHSHRRASFAAGRMAAFVSL